MLFQIEKSGGGNAAATVLKSHGKIFYHVAAEGSRGGDFSVFLYKHRKFRQFLNRKALF